MQQIKILALLRPPSIDASSRHRVYQFINILEEKYSIKVIVKPFYTNQQYHRYKNNNLPLIQIVKAFYCRFMIIKTMRFYDIVWISRGVAPIETPKIIKYFKGGSRVVFDFDDAIYQKVGNYRLRKELARNWSTIPEYLKISDLVFAGNAYLKGWAKVYNNNVEVIPTGLDVVPYRNINDNPKIKMKESKIISIGWVGTVSTSENLAIIRAPLEIVGRKYKIKFIQIGGTKQNKYSGIEYCYYDWSEDTQYDIIRALDIGVAPLEDNAFNWGKCGFKILQYMAASLPVVASPIGVQTEIINSGYNGYLASNEAEWIEKLEKLCLDSKERLILGQNAYKTVVTSYTKEVLAETLAESFNKLLSREI